jgi:hypothetical protein
MRASIVGGHTRRTEDGAGICVTPSVETIHGAHCADCVGALEGGTGQGTAVSDREPRTLTHDAGGVNMSRPWRATLEQKKILIAISNKARAWQLRPGQGTRCVWLAAAQKSGSKKTSGAPPPWCAPIGTSEHELDLWRVWGKQAHTGPPCRHLHAWMIPVVAGAAHPPSTRSRQGMAPGCYQDRASFAGASHLKNGVRG